MLSRIIATLLLALYTVAAFTLSTRPTASRRIQETVVIGRTSIADARNAFPLHYNNLENDEQFQLAEPLVPSAPDPNPIKASTHDLRRRARGLALAGSKDAYRISHSIVGLLSILTGLHHMLDVAVIHSFSQPAEVEDVMTTGAIHVAAGLLGLRRLHFGNDDERARNAMFVLIPIQNLWLVSAALTEWGAGSSAVFSMFGAPFVAFTVFNLLLTVWQLTEVWTMSGRETTKDTIWLDNAATNTFLVEFAYLVWMQIQMGALLYVSSSVDPQSFLGFVDRFPEMHDLLSNLSLNTAFFNNLVAFLATLIRYKLLAKPSKKDSTLVFSVPILTSLFITFKVVGCFLETHEGAMSSTFLSLVFQ